MPTTIFEKNLYQTIVKKEDHLPNLQLNTVQNGQKSETLRKINKIKSQYFNDMDQDFNLFTIRIEYLLQQSLFNIGYIIQAIMEVFTFDELFMQIKSGVDKRQILLSFCHMMVEAQLFSFYLYQRLFRNKSKIIKGEIKLEYHFSSYEASFWQLGTNTYFSQMAVCDQKQILRKALEIFFFILNHFEQLYKNEDIENQFIISNDLRKQIEMSKSLLRDYLIYRDNFGSDSLKRRESKLSPFRSVKRKSVQILKEGEIEEKLVNEPGSLMNFNLKKSHLEFTDAMKHYYEIQD